MTPLFFCHASSNHAIGHDLFPPGARSRIAARERRVPFSACVVACHVVCGRPRSATRSNSPVLADG
eukprot:2526386-Lingulodinium_polyedra.AAC.1